jgi:chromosome segregation ATPase
MELLIEIALLVLLAATLFHAVRLEKALGVLKRDRAQLEELVSGFNSSTRQAEQGIERLRATADGAGRQIARHVDLAKSLREDLVFLTERGERLADRLEAGVRTARSHAPEPPAFQLPTVDSERQSTTQSSRALEPAEPVPVSANEEREPRLRSQAERDLLKALRIARS